MLLSRTLHGLRAGAHGISVRSFAAGAFTSLPIIDVSALRRPDATLADRQAVGDELHKACRDVGFFYVKNHGMDDGLAQKVRTLSRQWFDLPEHVKREIALTDSRETGFRGYQALGANVTRYEGGFARDWHEAIDLYKDFAADAVEVQAKRPLHGPNPWPAQVPGYRDTLETYVEECTHLGSALLRGIALGLRLPEDFFGGERAGDPFWVMRIIHYPPLQSSEAASEQAEEAAAARAEVDRSVQLSCGEHTDYGLLTIVNQDQGMTALQVKNAAGDWVDAAPIPGTFVCNVGDMFKVWTNGLYMPTVHRVVNLSSTRHRISVPFFYEPNFDTVGSPQSSSKFAKPPSTYLATHLAAVQGCSVDRLLGTLHRKLCGPDSPAKYPGIVYGDHLQKKVFSNFEL